MKRAEAAKQLGQLLGIDLIGTLLDEVGDHDLRDLVLKVAHRTREIAFDAESADAMANLGGKIAPGVCVSTARRE